MSILFDVNLLKKDIDEYVHRYAEGIYEKAKKEVPEFAKYALLNYYDSYDPEYYKRTGNFMINGFKPYDYKNSNEYFAGVKTDSAQMDEYMGAGVSTSTIYFYNMEGYHGAKIGLLEYIPIISKSPYSVLKDKVESKSYISECNAYGEKCAKNGNYSLLEIY